MGVGTGAAAICCSQPNSRSGCSCSALPMIQALPGSKILTGRSQKRSGLDVVRGEGAGQGWAVLGAARTLPGLDPAAGGEDEVYPREVSAGKHSLDAF